MAVAGAAAIISGCSSGQAGVSPPYTSVSVSNTTKLTMAVGVATFDDGSQGLNVVAAFRNAQGNDATLLNTPTLTGPFVVPAGSIGTRSAAPAAAECAANVDDGTGHVTGSAQALPGTTAACTTLGQGGGVFAYGFGFDNSLTSGAPEYALFGDDIDASTGGEYGGPFYGAPGMIDDGDTALRGGPPAYPNTRDGTYPSGFNGFTLGYTTFAVTPVTGTYNLSVNVPSANTAASTVAAPSFTLNNITGLPAFDGPPNFVESGNGGGTATCDSPAGATETLIELVDENAGAYYTDVVHGSGTVSYTFADNLGPSAKGTTAPTIGLPSAANGEQGDFYEVVCIAADYPLVEAGPPNNASQVPALTGAAGTTDISFSGAFDGQYGTVEEAHSRKAAHSAHRMHLR